MNPALRTPSLDLLRAGALLLVMVRHMGLCPATTSPWLHEVTRVLQQGAWVGVDLFFVLSGFLVGGLLFQEHLATGRIRWGRFFARRAFKIYPVLWVCLALVWLARWGYGQPVTRWHLFADLFFYASYVRGLLAVGWSLAVEEHFYLLLPLLLAFFMRLSRTPGEPFRRFPPLVAVWAAGSLLLRAAAFGSEESFDFCAQFTATHLRLDGLLFGVLLAYYYHHAREAFVAFAHRHRGVLLALGVAGLLPPFFLPLAGWFTLVPGFTIQYLAAGALLVVALVSTPPASCWVRIAAAIGRQSYATYLLHYCIGTVGIAWLARVTGSPFSWGTCVILYVILSLAAGYLLTRWVERPMLAWRDRLFPSRPRLLSERASLQTRDWPFDPAPSVHSRGVLFSGPSVSLR